MPDFSRCSRRMVLTVYDCTLVCEQFFGHDCVEIYSSPDGMVLDIRADPGKHVDIIEARIILKNNGGHGVFEYTMLHWNNRMRSETLEFKSLDELRIELYRLLQPPRVSSKRPREYTNNDDVTDPDDRQRPYNPLRPSRLPDHFGSLSLRHMPF